jgi:hypothetical protein
MGVHCIHVAVVNGDELLGSINSGEFLDLVSDRQFFDNSAPFCCLTVTVSGRSAVSLLFLNFH